MGSSAIGTAHLLMGLLREGGNMGLRILRTVGVDPNKMYSAVLKKLNDMPRAAAGAPPPLTARRTRRTRRWPSTPAI